jgi:hypothetical protein
MNSVGKNTITFSEELLNAKFKNTIISSPLGTYLKDYKINFSDGFIYLDLSLNIKTLGHINAKYKLEITDLTFKPGAHILILDYIESVSSTGSLAQNMMLKAASLKGGTFLQTAINTANTKGIRADAKSCFIDISQVLRLDKRIASSLSLSYVDCRNGSLILSYDLNFAPNTNPTK